MAETTSTTETVTKSSSGNVKITLEEYNDLMERANRPQNVTYNQTVKTAAQVAEDNIMWGAVFMGGGLCMSVFGTCIFLLGRAQKKAL